MLNGEINTKSANIPVNNNTNLKKNLDCFYLHYSTWDRLSLKPSHFTVPLRGG